MNTSPNSSWFYSKKQERKGPVTFSELQTLLAEGLPQSSLVWTEGMEKWVLASEIPKLSPGSSGSPYAPPTSDVLPPATREAFELGDPPATPIPLDINYCISQAWKYTKANLGSLIVFGLVYFAIAFISSAILGGIAAAVEGPPPKAISNPNGSIGVIQGGGPLTSITNIISNIISIYLGLGAIRYGHRLLKGETPEIGDLFSQGGKLLTTLGATLLFAIAVAIGLFLLVVPGVILAIRLGFYQQAIVEKNLGVIDSLKYSMEITKTNGLSIFGLYILGFLIALAGLLALIVGLIWALPTVWLSQIIAFRYLHGGNNSIKEL